MSTTGALGIAVAGRIRELEVINVTYIVNNT
jgi:hypothetical protein